MERTSSSVQLSPDSQMPSMGLWTISTPALSTTVPAQVDAASPVEQAAEAMEGGANAANRGESSIALCMIYSGCVIPIRTHPYAPTG